MAGGISFAVIRAAVYGSVTCGLTAAGEAWCWGRNYSGELGNDTAAPSQIPVRVVTDARFTRLAQRATCGLGADGKAWCWGGNPFGNVGRRSHWAQWLAEWSIDRACQGRFSRTRSALEAMSCRANACGTGPPVLQVNSNSQGPASNSNEFG